jgi:hypothetical protein
LAYCHFRQYTSDYNIQDLISLSVDMLVFDSINSDICTSRILRLANFHLFCRYNNSIIFGSLFCFRFVSTTGTFNFFLNFFAILCLKKSVGGFAVENYRKSGTENYGVNKTPGET